MKKILSLIMVMLMVLSLAVTVSAEETILSLDGCEVVPTSAYPTNGIGQALDNDPNNYWHSDYQHDGEKFVWIAENPHAIYVKFPKPTKVSGFRYIPRQDEAWASGIWEEFNVYATADNENWEQIYYGTFEWGEDYKDRSERRVSWGDVEMVALQVEITKSVDKYCTAGVFNLLTGGSGSKINNGAQMEVDVPENWSSSDDTGGTIVDRDGWKYSASSSQADNGIGGAFDNKLTTYWHCNYEIEGGVPIPDPMPYEINIELPAEQNISGFSYTGRQDMDLGHWRSVSVYYSLDGEEYTSIGDFPVPYVPSKPEARVVSWGDIKMKYLKIEVTQGQQGFAVAANIDLLTGGAPTMREFDYSKWKISVDSVNMKDSQIEWGGIGAILDGNPDSIWHSYFKVEGNTATNLDKGPFYINITLPEVDVVKGFKYTPRQNDWQGRLYEYFVKVSDSDDGEFTTIYEGTGSQADSGTKIVDFGDIGVPAKRIQIEITKSGNDIGSISDFLFIAGQRDTRVVQLADFEKELYTSFYDRVDPHNFETTESVGYYQLYKLSNLYDENPLTPWQSKPSVNPVTLQIDFNDKHIFQRIKITPKQSKKLDGYWNKFDVLVSDDGIKYTTLLKDYSFEDRSTADKFIIFDEPIETRYVAFVIKSSEGGKPAAGEIAFLQTPQMRESETGIIEIYKLQIGSNQIEVNHENAITVREIDAAPYITSVGSTLIPLRGLLEEMGANVEWKGENKSIVITLKDKKIEMQIGDPLVYVSEGGLAAIRYTMTAPPRIKDGRTYVPVRFISEHLGYTVSWDAATQTITVD